MPRAIEDYALIGNCETAALVGRDGSVDWLCVPRFDSPACFAALLGQSDHGRWLIRPTADVTAVRRQYRNGTLILETEFETATGRVALIDCMAIGPAEPHLFRMVEGRGGEVRMQMELVIRLVYGSVVPWVRRTEDGLVAIGGPDLLRLHAPVTLTNRDFRTTAEFTVHAGQRVPFALLWQASHLPPAEMAAVEPGVERTEGWWRAWSDQCRYEGEYREEVLRSLITLKALSYRPTGGLVAAPTTSLPERLGGVRNWDYRYCWLRDATFALYALMIGGYSEEARAWREWLVRTVAGKPSQAQIVYGVSGERLLPEWELPWLPGFEGSAPVRVGNAAAQQFQLDVYGEVMDALHCARRVGLPHDENAWRVQRALVEYVESVWQEPDEGIWEVRGGRRHFTHSRVMAWVALDRAVKAVERFGLPGDVDRWRGTRDAVHADVCRRGFDESLKAFVQYYGGQDLDASLLMMPLVGFLPAMDARVRGTVDAIQAHLATDGFVARYRTDPRIDGLPPGEGAFLPCTFWLADNLARRRGGTTWKTRSGPPPVSSGDISRSTDPARCHNYGARQSCPTRCCSWRSGGLPARGSWHSRRPRGACGSV